MYLTISAASYREGIRCFCLSTFLVPRTVTRRARSHSLTGQRSKNNELFRLDPDNETRTLRFMAPDQWLNGQKFPDQNGQNALRFGPAWLSFPPCWQACMEGWYQGDKNLAEALKKTRLGVLWVHSFMSWDPAVMQKVISFEKFQAKILRSWCCSGGSGDKRWGLTSVDATQETFVCFLCTPELEWFWWGNQMSPLVRKKKVSSVCFACMTSCNPVHNERIPFSQDWFGWGESANERDIWVDNIEFPRCSSCSRIHNLSRTTWEPLPGEFRDNQLGDNQLVKATFPDPEGSNFNLHPNSFWGFF